ncbi:MAG: hypothetical protein A3B30_04330 [Candidatus Komeilibacteria bacterium RIFCSPLOWO2_01_FULL_52_15]|uniref:Glycosyl transferase family 1 domain-containing protein n=2 Tax=Candidatus Komeiliibacteriota TaxID=1817908 RepID=A0A1G2BRV2_9BACT|nr:MAG: hypothetical protein A2677_04090 [Candidatus Komeilibacteria bacterium RIFCSPHIGHO2_01_FULL_52_14]OGY91110.1 MAG: hypothetical protein A3B30_04330 [Candidatus Komeilibacteria bacterium RIFCSPLOWO2_01_FULL_52_15]
MKLLMITRKMDRNDALAGFTFEWARTFASLVDELHVICLEKGNTDGLPPNCLVYSLGKERGKNRLREIVNFFRLAHRLVPKVDGVFSHQNPEYGILVAPWCKLYHKKLIAWYTHKAVTLRLRVLTALVDTVITASPESFRLRTKKCIVMHHGIETDYFVPGRPDMQKRIVVSVSRISPTKRIDLMIDVFRRLLEREGSGVELIIAGGATLPHEQAYERSVREKVSSAGLSKSVTFLGPVPHSRTLELLQRSSLFLNFSRTGSLDKAVLEAMSCGVPVLTTNEAFRAILTPLDERMYRTEDPAQLADAAYGLLLSPLPDISRRLRDYVVRHHGLNDLLTHIVSLYA